MNANSFVLNAAPVMQFHGRIPMPPQGWTLGLLTKPPKPEGAGYAEVRQGGYTRQPLHLAPVSQKGETLRNVERITFGPLGHELATVTHAAIFKDEQVLFYGRLECRHRNVADSRITLPSQAIQLRSVR